MTNKEAIKYLQIELNENAYYLRITGRKLTDAYYKHFVLKYRLAILYAIKALRDADNKERGAEDGKAESANRC